MPFAFHIWLLSHLLFLFTACGGGSDSSPVSSTNGDPLTTSGETTPTTSSTTLTSSSKAIHTGQIKDSVTGEGLGNVEVRIGAQTATTDVNGYGSPLLRG